MSKTVIESKKVLDQQLSLVRREQREKYENNINKDILTTESTNKVEKQETKTNCGLNISNLQGNNANIKNVKSEVKVQNGGLTNGNTGVNINNLVMKGDINIDGLSSSTVVD